MEISDNDLAYLKKALSTNSAILFVGAGFSANATNKLKVLNAINDDFTERDQFLSTLQYVKLNGTIPGEPRDVTFSVQQYANRMNQKEPWYDHFVRDYATHPTIFVGSSLNEPLLFQA